jgi:hypothetical protein
MSSKTKAQFIVECKGRSAVLDDTITFSDTTLELFIDIALRAYSKRQPEVRVKKSVTLETGEASCDKPTDALTIINLWTPERSPIEFYTETDSETGIEQIYPGDIKQHSTDPLMAQSYYENPSVYQFTDVGGYSSFDIEYTLLQTMGTIKETGLEALYWYMEYLAYSKKSGKTALEAEEDSASSIDSITDRDATGASSTTTFSTKLNVSKNYGLLAKACLEKYESLTAFSYGTRG